MLTLIVPSATLYNEQTEEFIDTKRETLQLEHSLLSISKWESTWCKPFYTKEPKTEQETIDYIRCMSINTPLDPQVYSRLPSEMYQKVNIYIQAPMTATWFNDKKNNKPSRDIITSEIIYSQMIELNIPFQCEKWHINRLLTLIKVRYIRSLPPPKKGRTRTDVINQISDRNALNAKRREQLNTKG